MKVESIGFADGTNENNVGGRLIKDNSKGLCPGRWKDGDDFSLPGKHCGRSRSCGVEFRN